MINDLANKLREQWVINDKMYNSVRNLVMNKRPTEAVYKRLLELDTRHLEVVTQTKIQILLLLIK